jgi:1,4-dihydroxy-2-naphthoate octaprenyltransferase
MYRNWILAARPKTLTAAVVPILACTTMIFAFNYIPKWELALLALLSSLFIQIGTNYVNDAIDFKKGADTKERLGPLRVTQNGIFTYQQVMTAAFICFCLAAVFAIPLLYKGGWPILFIGIFSLFFAYSYTGGPFPLAYLGLGDLFVILFFGVIAVTGMGFLHTGLWLFEAFFLGIQIGLHCAILIAINNLRDIEGDKRVNKKTLPVRFGKSFARFEILLLAILPFIMNGYWFFEGFTWTSILPFLVLPIAIQIIILVFKTEPSSVYNKFLAKAAALHFLFALLLSVGFYIDKV